MGVFMACTWGSKVNGILKVFAIGAAVLVDLWDIPDLTKTPDMVSAYTPPQTLGSSVLTIPQEVLSKHSAARSRGIILIPFFVYLSFFWMHFAILIKSGPGDTFMNPQFQETLADNEKLMNSQGVSVRNMCQ